MVEKIIGIMAILGIPYREGQFKDGLFRHYLLPNGQTLEIKLG